MWRDLFRVRMMMMMMSLRLRGLGRSVRLLVVCILCEIKCKQPSFQCKLYQESSCLLYWQLQLQSSRCPTPSEDRHGDSEAGANPKLLAGVPVTVTVRAMTAHEPPHSLRESEPASH
eukprot:1790304-Rhodomonas_salina.1